MERVKKGERYWSITLDYGGVRYWENTESDVPENYRNWETNNYFHTKEEAEAYAKKIRKVLKGATVIDKLPSEEEIAKYAMESAEFYHKDQPRFGIPSFFRAFEEGVNQGCQWLKSQLTKEK